MPEQQAPDLRALVDRFVSDLSALIRQDALDAVRAALGESPAPGRRGPGRPRKAARRGPGRPRKAAAKRGPGRPRKKTAKKTAKTGRPRKTTSRKSGRRAPEDIAALGDTVLAHVRSNPGQRLEEIGRELGLATKGLKRPIANLMGAGKLRTEGQKRGTRYYAGKGGKRKTAKKATSRKGTKKKTAGRRKAARQKKATKRKAKTAGRKRRRKAAKVVPTGPEPQAA